MGKQSKKISKSAQEQVILNETQKNIVAIRKRMNRRELESDQPHPFTKYKIITYLFIFLFTPYGLYRVWKKNSGFSISEKWAQSMVSCVYLLVLYLSVVKNIPIY